MRGGNTPPQGKIEDFESDLIFIIPIIYHSNLDETHQSTLLTSFFFTSAMMDIAYQLI